MYFLLLWLSSLLMWKIQPAWFRMDKDGMRTIIVYAILTTLLVLWPRAGHRN